MVENMSLDQVCVMENDKEENACQSEWTAVNNETDSKRCNHMEVVFDALSENEGFARMMVAAFVMNTNPTMEELEDVKMAVSEAVTNSIIHGYRMNHKKERMEIHPKIVLRGKLCGSRLEVEIEDYGVGIKDINLAMQPMFTTRPDLERSGMGFAFMMCFMDNVLVESQPDVGTKITMIKTFGKGE